MVEIKLKHKYRFKFPPFKRVKSQPSPSNNRKGWPKKQVRGITLKPRYNLEMKIPARKR